MQNPKSATNGHTKTPPGAEVLNAVASYFRQYLVCDDQQLTILALWSASTCCEHIFATAPYLDIRSPEPCSGKSVCLNLLNCLCYTKGFLTGVPGSTLVQRFLPGRSFEDPGMSDQQPLFALLLDDCHHTFGRSERQPAVALLTSGSDVGGSFPWGQEEYYFFGPKAFASNNPLPRSLAARCIPIVLRRPKASEKFSRLQGPEVQDAADVLATRLKEWMKNVSSALFQAAQKDPDNLPITLSPGQKKCAEPLIHIADAAGGSWPAKIREALAAVFDPIADSPQLQMLWDVRSIFREKKNPEYLATSDLLSELRKMDSRPWSTWTSTSGRRLAILLKSFNIHSRRVHPTEAVDFRAYFFKDFQEAWDSYLLPLSACVERDEFVVPADSEAVMGGSKLPSSPLSSPEISAIGAD